MSHVFACSEMNIGEIVAQHVIESLQKGETSLIFSGKEVDFLRSPFDKQHDFNGTLLEVNKKQQGYYLGRYVQQKVV